MKTNSATLFANLNDNDYVIVEGYDDGTGTVIASKVEREADDDVIVQGIMTSFNQDTDVTVLGVTFQIQDPGETEFEQDTGGAIDEQITQAEFITRTTVNQSLIKIKDKDPENGVADEVEIELP